jgi:putative chitinase
MVNPDNNGAKIAAEYLGFKSALEAAGYRPGTTAVSSIEPSIVVQPQVGAPMAPMAPIPPVPVNQARPPVPPDAVIEEPPRTVQTGGLGAWLRSLFGRKAA